MLPFVCFIREQEGVLPCPFESKKREEALLFLGSKGQKGAAPIALDIMRREGPFLSFFK